MTELDRLIALNAKLQLVGKGNDVAERERFCSTFTQEAARLLHGEGWRRIRKTVGANVDGMDIDKLVNVNTFQVVDIIVDAGIASARVGFNHAGELRDTSRFIDVAPVIVPPAPPAPPAPELEPAGDELLEKIEALVDGRELTNHELDRIATALEKANKGLVALALKFGLDLS